MSVCTLEVGIFWIFGRIAWAASKTISEDIFGGGLYWGHRDSDFVAYKSMMNWYRVPDAGVIFFIELITSTTSGKDFNGVCNIITSQ